MIDDVRWWIYRCQPKKELTSRKGWANHPDSCPSNVAAQRHGCWCGDPWHCLQRRSASLGCRYPVAPWKHYNNKKIVRLSWVMILFSLYKLGISAHTLLIGAPSHWHCQCAKLDSYGRFFSMRFLYASHFHKAGFPSARSSVFSPHKNSAVSDSRLDFKIKTQFRLGRKAPPAMHRFWAHIRLPEYPQVIKCGLEIIALIFWATNLH